MEDKIISYKGTDSKMQCRVMQYEVGNVATAGDSGAATAGNCGAATSRGRASVGANGIACSRSDAPMARGGIGAVLVLVEETSSSYNIAHWKAIEVDGKTVKADTWYRLKNGELMEAGDDE